MKILLYREKQNHYLLKFSLFLYSYVLIVRHTPLIWIFGKVAYLVFVLAVYYIKNIAKGELE